MNNNENNFETLRQLLKLKQHEVPPPGFFNDFSDQVVSRIRAGEGGGAQSRTERLESVAPWLVRLLQIFETRPGLVGAVATSLCLLLTLGVVVGERSDVTSKNALPTAEFASAGTAAASISGPSLVVAPDTAGIVASTNPPGSLQPVTTLFGQPNDLPFQSVSFVPASR
ncbi:MAG: hypothetical protein WCH99_09555 [Verrucomicrobiota bacterium]